MSDNPTTGPDGEETSSAEGATSADIGALDGPAAAGSPAATGQDDLAPGDEPDDGGFSTSPPDPTTGPD